MRGKCLCVVAVVSLAVGGPLQGGDGEDNGNDVLKKIQGTWKFVSQELEGKPRPKEELAKQTITFAGDKWTVRRDDKVIQAGTHKFDPTKKPAQVDAVVAEGEDKRFDHAGHLRTERRHAKSLLRPQGQGTAQGLHQQGRPDDGGR